jgi:hypothetical protein
VSSDRALPKLTPFEVVMADMRRSINCNKRQEDEVLRSTFGQVEANKFKLIESLGPRILADSWSYFEQDMSYSCGIRLYSDWLNKRHFIQVTIFPNDIFRIRCMGIPGDPYVMNNLCGIDVVVNELAKIVVRLGDDQNRCLPA